MPAAGMGTRMGGVRKPFMELAGKPLILWTLEPFLQHPGVVAISIALGGADAQDPPPWLLSLDPRISIVAGGATRGDSVRAALDSLPEGVELVAVHDAARPLVSRDILDRCMEATKGARGAVAGWPAVDTLKEVDQAGRVVRTRDRSRIWHAQTPQVFPASTLREAYRRALAEGISDTDDAGLVERMGVEVVMVPGSPFNLKVTRPGDLPLAELFLKMEER